MQAPVEEVIFMASRLPRRTGVPTGGCKVHQRFSDTKKHQPNAHAGTKQHQSR